MNKPINIGQLKHRITINQVTEIKSPTTGEKVPTEVLYKSVWSKIDDVSGSESLEGKVISLNVRKYIVAYRKEIVINGETMLVVDVDGTYNVNSVQQVGFKQYLILKCSKKE